MKNIPKGSFPVNLRNRLAAALLVLFLSSLVQGCIPPPPRAHPKPPTPPGGPMAVSKTFGNLQG